MSLRFEWDPQKAVSNLVEHGIPFDEACSAFLDFRSVTVEDPIHSVVEARFVLLGYSSVKRLLVVIHTFRGDRIRIISARIASRKERSIYEK